jgi:hypothetical protein
MVSASAKVVIATSRKSWDVYNPPIYFFVIPLKTCPPKLLPLVDCAVLELLQYINLSRLVSSSFGSSDLLAAGDASDTLEKSYDAIYIHLQRVVVSKLLFIYTYVCKR